MRIGQEGDTRQFRPLKRGQEGVTHDVPQPTVKWPRCNTCGEIIRDGKKWRVAEGKYVCTRCGNENVNPSDQDQGDFLDADFYHGDFN